MRRITRLAVEGWSPEYGSPVALEPLDTAERPTDVNVELDAAEWRPLDPAPETPDPACVEFVDGVRRIDARVWITDEEERTHLGICASYAAGVVRCDGKARILDIQVRRALLAPAGVPDLETKVGTYPARAVADDDIETLINGLQQRMGELEIQVATEVGSAGEDGSGVGDAKDGGSTRAGGGGPSGRDTPSAARPLIVVDGPLSGRQNVPGAIGYIKSHRVEYLPEVTREVVAALGPGQRTPLFVTQTTWSRFSWYLRLPGGEGHPWAGVVRCEASADLSLEEAQRLADGASRVLPGFSSQAHKDPRAPQNLYPIAALEREMRRRLGDAGVVYRALRVAARP